MTAPRGSVKTEALQPASVVSDKLGDAAVTTAKLLDASVTTPKLADSSVTSAKIVDGTIATADIAALAITTALLANGAATSGKVSLTSSSAQSVNTAMTTAGTVYDGASLSLAAGTWLLLGFHAIANGAGGNGLIDSRIRDGANTTITGSTVVFTPVLASVQVTMAFGAIVSPITTTTYKTSATNALQNNSNLASAQLIAIRIA